jgi:hypothetical protein
MRIAAARPRYRDSGIFPVLGRLFSNNNDNRTKTEIVLLITPRIVRSLHWPRNAITDQPVGTIPRSARRRCGSRQPAPGSLALAPADGGGAGGRRSPVPGALPDSRRSHSASWTTARRDSSCPVRFPVSQLRNRPEHSRKRLLQRARLHCSLRRRSQRNPAPMLWFPSACRPGTPAVSARLELTYDPSRLEPVGAAVSAPGRLPVQSRRLRLDPIQSDRTARSHAGAHRKRRRSGREAATRYRCKLRQAMDMTITP